MGKQNFEYLSGMDFVPAGIIEDPSKPKASKIASSSSTVSNK